VTQRTVGATFWCEVKITVGFLREWIRANLTSSWVAKRNVAASYALGDGVDQDGRRARAWYGRAARAGDVSALYDLGMMLLEGEGGAPDLAEGRALLVAAAEAGDPMAQKVLAYLFGSGLFGFEVDREQQAKWTSLARQQGMQV
jgi:localization factor PodJL